MHNVVPRSQKAFHASVFSCDQAHTCLARLQVISCSYCPRRHLSNHQTWERGHPSPASLHTHRPPPTSIPHSIIFPSAHWVPLLPGLIPLLAATAAKTTPAAHSYRTLYGPSLPFHFHLLSHLCACIRCSSQAALANLTASTQPLGLCFAVPSAWSTLSPISAGYLLASNSDIPSGAFSPAQPESLPGVPLCTSLSPPEPSWPCYLFLH